MKKLSTLIVALVVTFQLVSCGSDKKEDQKVTVRIKKKHW